MKSTLLDNMTNNRVITAPLCSTPTTAMIYVEKLSKTPMTKVGTIINYQTISLIPFFFKNSLHFENGRLPKNPL